MSWVLSPPPPSHLQLQLTKKIPTYRPPQHHHHHHSQTKIIISHQINNHFSGEHPNAISPKQNLLFTNFISIAALTLTLNSPLPSLAIPSLNSQSPPTTLLPTTPFSQSKNLPLGIQDGKIRPCPSINPSCVSTNPKSSSFEFPLTIPEKSVENAMQKLQEAIMNTQKNAKIQLIEDTPYGQYLQAEVDGGFNSRDVIEFLVKRDVAAYRCMATKVTYIYPFTTALGDSKGQSERIKRIVDQLGWYGPSFDQAD